MKATKLIKELQDIIDKEQKDFKVKYQDSYGLYNIDDIIVAEEIAEKCIYLVRKQLNIEQSKPKFKVGDIVRVKYIPIYKGEIGIIDEIGSRILEYHLKGNKTLENVWFAESYLESYTESKPKFNLGE